MAPNKQKLCKFFEPREMEARLAELDPVKVVDQLSRMEPDQQAVAFEQLSGKRARAVFEKLDVLIRRRYLRGWILPGPRN